MLLSSPDMSIPKYCNGHSRELLLLHLMIIISFFLEVSCVPPLSFHFTKFNPNHHDIKYEGDASSSGSAIQLTTNDSDKMMNQSTGRAIYYQPMHLWDNSSGNLTDFSTNFSFVIDSQGKSPYAEGIAFFLAPVGFPIPKVQQGRGLGLVSGDQTSNSTEYPFVAVEFDTHANREWDPDRDHVGIDINSMISKKNVTWLSSILDGRENKAWISYNSSSKNLSVVFTGFRGNQTILQNIYYQVDLRDYLPEWVTIGFSAATGKLFEIHTLHSWHFSSNLQTEDNSTNPKPLVPVSPIPDPKQKGKNNTGLVVGLSVGACVLVGGLGFVWFCLRIKSRTTKDDFSIGLSMDKNFEKSTGPRKFSYHGLACATNHFAEKEKLGEGGFGGVYKGFLRDLNSYVAVKRVSRGSRQGIKEYESEVKIISRLRHRNLVQLIGWCHEKNELLLVYEYMPNGSLDSHLFKEKSLLTWEVRYKIAQGLASALLYVHEGWEQCIVHRDIKSSNVLLDSTFNAKLGDFGLARLVDHEKGSQTTVLAGTMGYMAPELPTSGKASKKSDVYSFGIVALEIACGRKPINHKAEENQVILVEWVWELHESRKLLEAADPRLGGEFDKLQMERLMIIGLWCAHPNYRLRPSIKQVIHVLNFESPLPTLPTNMPMTTSFPRPVSTQTSSSCSCDPNDSQFTYSLASSSVSAAPFLKNSL